MGNIGRQVKYGFGLEGTQGTEVAATHWVNQLAFELNPRTEYATNTSAYGVLEKTNSSTPMRHWAEGNLEAKLTDKTGGLILGGAFGEISTAPHADASGLVKVHTANLTQSMEGKTSTLIRKDGVVTEAHTMARFGEWTLTMALDDYVKYTAAVMARRGTSTTATPAYESNPTEFVAKHFNVKTATTAAGLGAASAISKMEAFTLTVNPNIEIDWEAGNPQPYAFSSRGYDISFELTKRYVDNVYRDAYNNGTDLAMLISAVNTNVTIGTAANPGFAITAPLFNITDWTHSEDLDAPMTETLTGTIHYSAADAYALRAAVTNLQTSY